MQKVFFSSNISSNLKYIHPIPNLLHITYRDKGVIPNTHFGQHKFLAWPSVVNVPQSTTVITGEEGKPLQEVALAFLDHCKSQTSPDTNKGKMCCCAGHTQAVWVMGGYIYREI